MSVKACRNDSTLSVLIVPPPDSHEQPHGESAGHRDVACPYLTRAKIWTRQKHIQLNRLLFIAWPIVKISHRPKPETRERKGKILMDRGGVTAVRSVVHDMLNTERLLSKCFSQGPPHRRTSSEQAHHLLKRFAASSKEPTRPRFTILQAPTRTERHAGLCPLFSLPMSSISCSGGSRASVSLGMG